MKETYCIQTMQRQKHKGAQKHLTISIDKS